MQSIIRWFGEIGTEPDIVCYTSHYVDALAMTMQGMGISLFPQSMPSPTEDVEVKTIVNPQKWVEYVLVWNRATPPGQMAQHIIREVEQWRREQPPLDPNITLL